ncbi:MAG: hypothetical protein CMC37_01965 [Flavobacteriaceae bacterium]|nr:hypothetical protein [Flavobacteriaceae bacterium]
MRYLFIFLLSLTFLNMNSQENLPFYEIPDYPESYSEAEIVGRMIDGLGFRYYWATEGLTDTDLAYKLPNDSRSSIETIVHIYDLSNMILYTALNSPIEMMSTEGMGFKEIRKNTLLNLKQASDIIKKTKNFEDLSIIFLRNDKKIKFPFWNQLNGPIEDAVWHCGQVVAFRRASGNPISNKISVFTGKVQED